MVKSIINYFLLIPENDLQYFLEISLMSHGEDKRLKPSETWWNLASKGFCPFFVNFNKYSFLHDLERFGRWNAICHPGNKDIKLNRSIFGILIVICVGLVWCVSVI